MRNLKISTRLWLGFGLLILLILLMSGIGGWRMISTEEDNAAIQNRQIRSAMILRWEGIIRVNASQTLALANLIDPEIKSDFQQAMQATDQQAEALDSQIEAALRFPKAQAIFQEAMKYRQAFYEGRDRAFKNLENGDQDSARKFFREDMPKLTASYLEQVDALAKFQENYVASTISSSDQANTRGMMILAIATLLALLFSPWFAWQVTRSITRPLRAAVQLAADVAQRNLNVAIRPTGRDEVTQLETALNDMIHGLRDIVSQVRLGADTIATAAGQISAGNLDLSARTEQQSASLAQTAASMEEITSTVRQNADNAQQANTLAATATQSADGGGKTVHKLVDTMSSINTKSQQIAEIVGVIDSIAFQTNILALNAAVEAARAGEQGRGFAVVAAEVRALAQRSATSAKEIKDLIDAAVDIITHGNEDASQAGTSMQGIVGDIARVTSIMSEISAASQEQTTGIEQVNIAVTQMDDVTRQNASLVEESAAAASSLEAQAQTLSQLVATFQLDDGTRDDVGQARYLPAPLEKTLPSAAPRRQPGQPARRTAPTGGGRPALGAPAQPVAVQEPEWSRF
ncbi:methyl-accepting chemotaxis protein [Castellaniella hirudinis]|uniref:methyl-accepting chemotaxis protein n=1 Tax=Castellaniella hirudinis TaxID=1144617 RepID=UPI0039C42E4F